MQMIPRKGVQVHGRELLKGAAASLATGLAPRLAVAGRNKTLVFVPTSDLTVLDPIVGTKPWSSFQLRISPFSIRL
jgi:hypothetical protein